MYFDVAIETAQVIKGVFNLSQRALERFTTLYSSLWTACDLTSYSCTSKRTKSVEIKYRAKSRGLVAQVVIDTAGLKV